MSTSISNRRFRPLAAAAVAAVSLGALAVPLAPAKAQLYFGAGPGGFDIGVGAPAYYPPYYAPYYSPYYYHPYYHHYRHW